MKALILVNGELYQPDVLRNRISTETFDLVLAADGGMNHADTLNVTLDVVIGDMDSVSELALNRAGTTKIVSYSTEKDETDLELALLYAEEEGADQIVIVGVMGGRIDMTLANILLITRASINLCRVEVWIGEETGWVIRPPGEDLSGHHGDTLSIIPLAGDALGITTTGLKYSLADEDLTFGSTRGISNLLEKPSVHIKLSEGLLMVVHTPGN